MSLFENPEFEWRETFFILFDSQDLPSMNSMTEFIERLGSRIQVKNLQGTEDGIFESLTLYAPDDFAAMDIVCVHGEEVIEQLPGLIEELEPNAVDDEEKDQLKKINHCNARLDVFHFEQHSFTAMDDEEPDSMDPGGLLIVLERLATLCEGVVVDPQSASVM